ncbi:MAG TPA: hypothetical protein VIG72_01525, partial [Pontibacter sp.]
INYMQLHKDGLIELNYNVASDILIMRWPDLTGFTMPEIDYAIRKIIDTLRHYDIKHLLVDSRFSTLSDLTRDEYQQVLVNFVQHLKTTRLQKLARICTPDASRELVIDETADLAINQLAIKFHFRNFADEVAALMWLSEK